MSQTETKTPPNSKEAEMIVLGCMLASVGSLIISSEMLETDDFYYTEHKIIFTALKECFKQEKPADVHIIAEDLKRQDKLKTIGGVAYLTSLVQYAGTAAHIEEYSELVREKSLLRKLIALAEKMKTAALNDPNDLSSCLDHYRESLDNLSSMKSHALPIPLMENHLEELDEKLKTLRGRTYLGLCQKTIPEIDEKFLGLRKLIVLAAAPNVGKTALTNQFVIDVLKNHPEACVVYFSLEMSIQDLLIRMLCNQTRMDYRKFVLGGDESNGALMKEAFFDEEEMKTIAEAETFLKSLKNRLQIVDREMCPFLTASQAISHIKDVKQRTGCERVFVVIDYLQVWPLNPQAKFFNENEIDKWRIGEAMKIRNAIDGDPIIVISEARKPQGEGKWGGDLSDVMGAARMTYSPDAVLLFSQLDFDELSTLWANDGKLRSKRKKGSQSQKAQDEDIERLYEYLESAGISICRLDMPKGRDGTQKFSILIEFHYRKNVFRAANFPKIKAESEKHKVNSGRTK